MDVFLIASIRCIYITLSLNEDFNFTKPNILEFNNYLNRIYSSNSFLFFHSKQPF